MDPTGISSDLQCTICFKLVVSPILNCVNGHLVCGLCSDKISQCPVCKTILNASSLAERLVRKYEFKRECSNHDFGCNQLIKCADMKNHLGICEFKEMLYKCHICARPANQPKSILHLEREPLNKDSTLSKKAFIKHLLDAHHTREMNSGDICTTPFGDFWVPPMFQNSGIIIREDGNEFLLHTGPGETTLNQWVTILGNDSEANKYDYIISVKPQALNYDQRKIGLVWRLPVLPFMGNSSFQGVSKSGKYCSVHQSAVETRFAVPCGLSLVSVKIVKLEEEKGDDNCVHCTI